MNYKLRILGGYAGDMMNYEYWVLNVKRRLLSSVEKAKMLMGYITEHRQTGFEDGLKKVHAWFVENLGDIGWSVEF